MTSEGYSIPLLTVSGGGHPSMEGGSYKLHDLAAQTVIGTCSATGYSAQLGGIYGFIVGGGATEEGVPAGTVRLYISRQGSDIKLSWSALAPPEIYILTGTAGSGQYKNGASYYNKQIYPTTHPDYAGQIEDHSSEKYILHKGEAGSAYRYKESYYKGVEPGRSSRLDVAWAAGKYSYTLSPGWNLISYPFIAETPNTPDNLFGAQLNGGTKLTADRFMQKKSASSFSYNWAYLRDSDNTWRDGDTDGSSGVLSSNVEGYFVWVKGAEKKVTLVGRVASEAAYAIDAGWDLIGVGYPVSYPLNVADALGLSGAGALAATRLTADRIMRKKSPDSFSYFWAYLDSSDNMWHDGDTGDLFSTLFQPPYGYFYWRKGAATINLIRRYSD